MNLPAHGTASPDPSKASLSVKNNTPESKEQQCFHLARPTRRQAKLFQTAWRYSLTARRQRPPKPTVFLSPPGGSYRVARRLSVQGSLTLCLSPGGDQQAARRHIRGILQLIFGTPFWLILQPKLLEGQLTFWTHINAIKQNTIKVAPPGRNSLPPGDSNQNKNIRSSLMSRLAVGIKPPGGFWEKPRNLIEQCRKQMEACDFNELRYSATYMY
ncbi:hypothetical protein DEO72_LG6g2327 [Vigna unguiculata]|uniref:Uncharacterized protein n=1 Tax=Vigna unguiculata TaxID=3917 RepID=A0A4D6MC19_VIGUN|nr:hypothetical protein DEO72_LG6g2327 [Vigna unguiculata]